MNIKNYMLIDIPTGDTNIYKTEKFLCKFSQNLGRNIIFYYLLFKGLRPPAADPQKNEGMMVRGYDATRLLLW